MKRPNPKSGVHEGEESLVDVIDHNFSKIIEENFPQVKGIVKINYSQVFIEIQETQTTPNRQDKKLKSPQHIVVKIQSREDTFN